MERILSYVEAVREATQQEMERDKSVIVFGLDVDDPKAIQGTTKGLVEKDRTCFHTARRMQHGVAIAWPAGQRPISSTFAWIS
jgi:pyruvate/2-oxoglutarate/acetoin dehydrogenase E1 component